MFGLYGLLLLLLGLASLLGAVAARRRWAPYVFAAGLTLTALITASLTFHFTQIYDWTGINLYFAMMLALILSFAGTIGLSLRAAQRIIAWMERRRGRSPTAL